MSAYDKLGLAMIPSGYKGEADENNAGGFLGKVYSVLPAQTEIDVLNIQSVPTWANWDGSVITTDGNGDTGYINLVQQYEAQAGKTYKLTLTAELNNTVVAIYATGNVSVGIQEGTNTYTFVHDGNSNMLIRLRVVNDAGITLSNISLVQVSNGDFDFSRGSDATRVNSQGYIESVQVLSDELVQNGDFEEIGSELVTNGGFDTDSDWNKVGLVDIQNGVASFVDNGTNVASLLSQNSILTTGKVYELTFDVVRYNAGNIQFSTDGTYENIDISGGVNTYTHYFKALNTTIYFKRNGGFPNYDFDIDNVSVKEVGQNWTFGTNTTIVDDNGNLKMKFDNASLTQVYQGGIVYSGKKYRVTYDFDVISGGGGVRVEGGGFASGYLNTSGTKTFDFETTSNSSLMFRVGGTTITATIDNVSLIEITDDTDIPRLDYSDGACPTLLLEPQRINLIEYSEDFSDSYWINSSVTITPNQFKSPDNSLTADLFELDADNDRLAKAISLPAGTYTFSFYVKAKEGESGVWVSRLYGDVALTTSTNVSDSEWVRVEQTVSRSSAGNITIYPAYRTSGTSTLFNAYIWGAQLEEGSYPTSYIPTNGSTVTRLADVCNNAGDSTIFNDAEGVLYWEFKPITTSEIYQLSISDGTGTNSVLITFSSNGSISYGNVEQTTGNDGRGYKKVAVRHNNGTCSLFVDGSLIETDTNTTVSGLRVMQFGQANLGSSYHPKGNTRSLLYFNEALTDAELEKLTSSTATQVLNNYSTLLSRVGATYESSGLETKLNELL